MGKKRNKEEIAAVFAALPNDPPAQYVERMKKKMKNGLKIWHSLKGTKDLLWMRY